MKYVYVLVSSPSDLYYEQAVMSVYSLRKHMANADIEVLVDNKTFESFTGKRTALKKYATNIISIDFEDYVKNVERSRLIKTSIPEYIKGDFLYIDCDTIIARSLEDLESIPFTTAGVLDGHCMLNEHMHQKYFLERDKKLGFHATKIQGYNLNGGIVFARESEESRKLFKKWNELWKYSAFKKHDLHDQSALNEANYQTGLKMQLLPGEWNCQPSQGGLAYLKDARIIHYFSSEFSGKSYIPYYKLADKQLQMRLKETNDIPDDIKHMIEEPLLQFNHVHLINDARIISIMQSPLIFTLADMKQHVPLLFNTLENLAGFA
ncbi:MAG: glycosyl transferase, partial [Treponema sp.]|nr:glycosyl transferase [Treponema sp.]